MGKKGNILGDPFKDFVRKQINQRQESLGKYTNIENKDLLYYNSKTPWLRLASSIDIYSDSRLAKGYILQGGVVSYSSGGTDKDGNETGSLTPMKSGIGVGGAYQFLKDEDRGNIPLPGITSADVKYENNGALTLTTVKIKCFSRAQLNIIDKLYLRPGFSMLLEFGWSVYLDNDGNLKTFDEFTTPPLDFFMNGTKNQYVLQEEIEKEQKKHCGNYEAILGVVTNFSWDIQNDGTYDCMIEMSGVGEVIETIGVEKKTENETLNTTNHTDDDKKDINEIVGFDFTYSKIHEWLSYIYLEEYIKSKSTSMFEFNWEFWGIKGKNSSTFNENPLEWSFVNTVPKDNLHSNAITQGFLEVINTQYIWVRFGRLLEFIEGNLLGNDKNGNTFPKFGVNYDELEKDPNYIQINKHTISTDPRICIVPFDKQKIVEFGSVKDQTTTDNNIKEITGYDNTSLYIKLQEFKGFINENDSTKGRLMNVGLNMVYIAKTVEKYLDKENGHFSVLEFLQTILSDINKCLGGINEIEIQSDKGYVRFINKSPNQLMKVEDTEKITTINIHGVIPNADDKDLEGSFVRNANIKSEIPKNFSSMVAIGAMANNVAVSQDISNFKQHNYGLKDRIITHSPRKIVKDKGDPKWYNLKPIYGYEEIDVGGTGLTPRTTLTVETITQYEYFDGNETVIYSIEEFNTLKDKEDTRKQNILKAAKDKISRLKTLHNSFKNLYFNNQIYQENITPLQSFLMDKIKTTQKEEVAMKFIDTPFFLPFNVSLDMDGLSGMTLYQKFKTTKTIFPSDYANKDMNLVVNSVNHNITPQLWVTQISAIPHPEPKLKPKSEFNPENVNLQTPKEFPNAQKLRNYCNSTYRITIKIMGELDELVSSGNDIDPNMANRAIEYFRNLLGYSEDTIEITAGNDNFHMAKNSLHASGRAIDFVFTPREFFEENPRELKERREWAQKAAEAVGVGFLDEYETKTEDSTGPHIHIFLKD